MSLGFGDDSLNMMPEIQKIQDLRGFKNLGGLSKIKENQNGKNMEIYQFNTF